MGIDKKANVLAAVIVGVVLLAAGAILVQQIGSNEQKVDDQQKITTEADTAMKHAVSLGISEWMLNGFSDQNKVWYSTGAIPPDITEANDSLKKIVNDKVTEYMDRLRNEDDDYYISPDLHVDFDVKEPLDYDFSQMDADVSDFEVGIHTEDSSQSENLSTNITFPYKAWEIYSNLHDWMETNAGDIIPALGQNALEKNACQLVTSGCECTDTDFDKAMVESLKMKNDDVTAVLDDRIAALNSEYFGDDVECSYQIDMMDIQNTEKIRWTLSDIAANDTVVVDYQPDVYDYVLRQWVEDKTLPKGDSCGGLPQPEGATDIPDDCTVRPNLNIPEGTTHVYTEPDPNDNEVCAGYTASNLAQPMKVGKLAMDKKLSVLLTVSCSDKNVQIETVHGLEPLTAEIKMRISIALDCPLPDDLSDIAGDDPKTCPGGSCFPAGTMISMADGSKKPIEDVSVGDKVLSYNTYTGELRPGIVMELESPVRDGLYDISFSDGTSINVTNEHPFYTKKSTGEVGWASIMPEETLKETKSIDNVMSLEVGDYIMKVDQTWNMIDSITNVPGIVQTYNLKEVSSYDNYFADDLLAHNKCCFAAGTPVTMADGTTKSIEDVNIGDFVLSYNLDTGKLEPSEVLDLQQPIREGLYTVTFENGKELSVTNDHPLYTDRGWAAIDVDAAYRGYALDKIAKLEVGTGVLQQDMTYSKVRSIAYVPGDVQTYTLKKVSKNHNFFADGFLAHNQKLIGYVGLACPITCPTCEGCQPKVSDPSPTDENDWECVGPLPGMICGDCEVCDADGNCGADVSTRQTPGFPCFDINGDDMEEGNEGKGIFGGGGSADFTSCMACDSNYNCVLNPPEITSRMEVSCNGGDTPCAKCSGNYASPSEGGCNTALDQDMDCNDERLGFSRLCQICQAGSPGACVPSSSTEECGPCLSCQGGLCQGAAPGTEGNCQTDDTPCMKCGTVPGVCVPDPGGNECGKCGTCGSDGTCAAANNDASCGSVPDCNHCESGSCIPYTGWQQKDSDGCMWTCDSSGNKKIANPDATCTLDSACNLKGICTDSGCETDPSKAQQRCCGSQACPQSGECCPDTNSCQPCATLK